MNLEDAALLEHGLLESICSWEMKEVTVFTLDGCSLLSSSSFSSREVMRQVISTRQIASSESNKERNLDGIYDLKYAA